MACFDYSYLKTILLELPPPVSDAPLSLGHDFSHYVPSADGLAKTESVNGAVNYDLEKILGLKCDGLVIGNGGPGLAALADLLDRYTKEYPEDVVLTLWGPAVLAAAEKAYVASGKPFPSSTGGKTSSCPDPDPHAALDTPSKVRNHLAPVFQKKRSTVASQTAGPPLKKRKTKSDPAPRASDSVPPWVDVKELSMGAGRPADPLLRRLAILCYDSSSNDQTHMLRCCGSLKGCTTSWVVPRNKSRIFKHASACTFVDSSLRQQASSALSANAPSVQVEQQLASIPSLSIGGSNAPQPHSIISNTSLHSISTNLGREQLKAVVDFALVRFICDCGIAPTCVDRDSFKNLLSCLNSRYTPVSSSTLSDSYIPREAALVTEKSVRILQQEMNLSISVDGGAIRRSRSVYTFHVATPGRRIFFMRGEDTSTQSHTGEHIASLALQVMEEIGPHCFSAIVTDGAANVKCARGLIVDKLPTVLNLSDPCHKLSLLLKDICTISEFKPGIRNLRRSLKYFSKSTYATAQLTERRQRLGISRGLQRIGRTRFGTVCIAAESMLRCLPVIRELVSEGVFVVPDMNHLFVPNSPATIQFEMHLTVLTSVLSPILRGLTCLESSYSTPADVLLCFSAALGQLDKLFASGSHGLVEESSVARMRAYCNRRFSELINESPDDIYVVAFYLDPYYRNSRLLRKINPLSITITLNPSNEFSSHAPTTAMVKRIGASLISMLRKEWESHPEGAVRSMYANPKEAMDALRQQLLLYSTSQYPFSEPIGDSTSAYTWWRNIACHPTAKLLAYFAIKLFSIVPNSMADERTVSTFSWLNSALRNRQDVATVVRQTQIRQYYGWDEVKHSKAPSRIRFRDTRLRKVEKKRAESKKTHETHALPMEDESHDDTDNCAEDTEEFGEDADGWLDGDMVPLGANDHVTTLLVGDLVDLDAPELEDCLADEMPARLIEKRREMGDVPKAGNLEQSVGGQSDATDWVF